MTQNNPLTLEELINKLEQQPQSNRIFFDFGNLAPTTFDSWRGDYSQIALGYEEKYPSITVGELLGKAKEVVGNTYMGYKGGTYFMSKDTPVMVDNWGRYTLTALVDVISTSSDSLLVTGYFE